MAEKKQGRLVKRIKTGGLERRVSLTAASMVAGTRMATHMATNLWGSKAHREERRKQNLSEDARFFVKELGKLKGSVVKIGQMLAIYGEHFLPDEVTAALHTLESETTALEWSAMEKMLVDELGKRRLSELEVNEKPIGAASLSQVYVARRKSDGTSICLKVQYPGVADAIDTDLNDVARLLKLLKLVSFGSDFDAWIEEARTMIHREVDYVIEAEMLERFRKRLRNDSRFIVPKVYREYSTKRVLAMSYEAGHSISGKAVQSLSQARRNKLAVAFLDLFLKEIFEWGEIQSDPNFGNFYVRFPEEKGGEDRIILLDFGAVRAYPDSFLDPVRQMIRGAYEGDLDMVEQGALEVEFMKASYPERVRRSFAETCAQVIEPLVHERLDVPPDALNKRGEYCWKASDLPSRIGKRAAKSSFGPYFAIPPKDFVLLSRKLIGVYTILSVLDAQFNGDWVLEPYLYGKKSKST